MEAILLQSTTFIGIVIILPGQAVTEPAVVIIVSCACSTKLDVKNTRIANALMDFSGEGKERRVCFMVNDLVFNCQI